MFHLILTVVKETVCEMGDGYTVHIYTKWVDIQKIHFIFPNSHPENVSVRRHELQMS